MSSSLRAAVVGAGAIGARLDEPDTREPLTHAGGYRCAGFDLVAIADVEPGVDALARAWGCKGYRDFDAMMRTESPDVVSLAVTTAARADLLLRTLAYRPKVVVAEKPLTMSAKESADIVQRYEDTGVALIVNYTRRFVPAWHRLKNTTALSATIRYAKGIRHNGTHAVDLCRMLFGECMFAQKLAATHDFWPDDPTVSAFLKFERCPEVFFQGFDEKRFTAFEVDITTENSRMIVDQDGRRLRLFEMRDGVGIPPGKRLVEVGTEDTGAGSAMMVLMRHIHEVAAGARVLCSGRDAIAAQRIAEQLAA